MHKLPNVLLNIMKVLLKAVLSLGAFLLIILGIVWVIFVHGPYDASENKSIALPAEELLSTVDYSKYNTTIRSDYFFMVKDYADFMITHGRDRYGVEHSPLFATTLDRKTGTVYRKDPPPAPKGIRDRDRTYRGANPANDNGLFDILYSLTAITGDLTYAQEADESIKWFFKNCQSPKTGLMAWGEHLGWDFFKEATIKWNTQAWYHEYKGFGQWDRAWKLAPEACERFALGLWDHQIYAKTGKYAGEFSRHANYYWHSPSKGRAFPGHGGNYIEIWTRAYLESGNEEFLTAIRILLSYYEKNTSPVSGAINYATDFPAQYSLGQSMGLATSLYTVKDYLPEDISARMKKMADATDALYLSFDHDPTEGGHGFLKSAHVHTLEPGEYRWEHLGESPYTKMWSAGYGGGGNSGQANSCYKRYKQTGIEGYRDLFMKSAEAYYAADLPPAEVLYPSNYSSLFGMMRHAYDLTGEGRFLQKAQYYMDLSIGAFMDDSSPLPKASNKSDHYEAITGGPGMMNNLLVLWMELNQLTVENKENEEAKLRS